MYKRIPDICRTFLGEAFFHVPGRWGCCTACGRRRVVDDYGTEIWLKYDAN